MATEPNVLSLLLCVVESGELVTLFVLSDRIDPSIDPSIDPCIEVPSHPTVGVLKSLILAGANVNARDNQGWTALMIAAHNCDMPRIRILVEAGADILARDQQGKTAIDHTSDIWEDKPSREERPSKQVRQVKPGQVVSFRVRVAGDHYVTTDEYRAARNFLWRAAHSQQHSTTHLAPK